MGSNLSAGSFAGTMRRATLFGVILSLLLLDACAVETSFARFFRYERTAQDGLDDVLTVNATPTPSPTPVPRRLTSTNANTIRKESYGSLADLIRWNTFTAVADFGMEAGARVEIEITNLTYSAFPPVYSSTHVPVVFALYDIDQWRAYGVLRLRDMPLKSPTILCHYPAAMRYTLSERSFRARRDASSASLRVVFDVKRASLYTLQVQVCGDASVYVAGSVRMVNRGVDGSLSQHLAIEELGLVALYQGIIFIYCIFAFAWILEAYVRRKTIATLAHVFQMALHVKTMESFIKLWYYRELSLRGVRESTLKTAKDVADSVANAVLLSVMLLAALGWSLIRDALSARERRFMGLSFVFYLLIALMKATCSSEEEDVCKAYLLTEYLIKSLMMLGVIVALNFTISQLRLELNEARWNNLISPLMYMKLNQIQGLRYVFLPYLLVPTALLILEITVVTPVGYWRYDWANSLLAECSILSMFVGIALNLRPIDPYVFSHISRGTDPGGAASRNTASPPSTPPGNVVAPDVGIVNATIEEPPRTATVQVVESNRRLLREYGNSSSLSPPRSPTRPVSPRPAPVPLPPVSLMLPSMGRRPM